MARVRSGAPTDRPCSGHDTRCRPNIICSLSHTPPPTWQDLTMAGTPTPRTTKAPGISHVARGAPHPVQHVAGLSPMVSHPSHVQVPSCAPHIIMTRARATPARPLNVLRRAGLHRRAQPVPARGVEPDVVEVAVHRAPLRPDVRQGVDHHVGGGPGKAGPVQLVSDGDGLAGEG